MSAVKPIEQYLFDAIASFDENPPENDYQHGYLAALITTYREHCAHSPYVTTVMQAMVERIEDRDFPNRVKRGNVQVPAPGRHIQLDLPETFPTKTDQVTIKKE